MFRWRLLYSSETGAYRSSPFFWAFAQTTRDYATPVAVPSSTIQAGDPVAAAVYAITDAIPFYDVAAVTQTISGACDPELGCEVDDDDDDDVTSGPADGATFVEEPSDGTSDRGKLEEVRACRRRR